MKDHALESGLLQMLRLYGILALLAVPILRRAIAVAFGWDMTLTQFLLLTIPVPLLLIVYTSVPGLQRRMGRAFLPTAIGVFAAYSIIQKFVTLQWLVPAGSREILTLLYMLNLWLTLQFLMLFVAWQYNLYWVTFTGISLCLVDAVLSLPFVSTTSTLYPLFVVIVGGRLLAVTGVAIGLAFLIMRQRAQRAQLADANRKLALTAATTEHLAASYERNRLARELHDTLAHSLSGLTVELEAVDALWDVDADKARTMLKRALQNTRSGLTEARRALRELRASPLEDLGLALALQNLAESVANRARLDLDLELPPRLENVPPPVEQCVYRVAQEALTNIVRHAQATEVRVALERANSHLTLTVADNGRGFDQAQVDAARYGLAGMRERAEMIGGKLQIFSQPQNGTTVQLVVVVQPQDAAEE